MDRNDRRGHHGLLWLGDAGDAPDNDKLSARPAIRRHHVYTFLVPSRGIPHTMSASYFQERASSASQNGFSPSSPSVAPASRGANALSSRITSVLSASYADLEIRDALETLDSRGVENTSETRRQLRLHVQKEVVQCNGEIIKDFGQVAEVCQVPE
jgi:hypothetical protein